MICYNYKPIAVIITTAEEIHEEQLLLSICVRTVVKIILICDNNHTNVVINSNRCNHSLEDIDNFSENL